MKFLCGIFGDYNVMKQSVACFGCKHQVNNFDEHQMYSLLVIQDIDNHYEFKLFRGKQDLKLDMKDNQFQNFNKDVQRELELGHSFVLGVAEKYDGSTISKTL